ncbi:MAG TPA: hypothetical protein VFY71_11620 [Planctomycetota bacterium]|nr:hypothetical protein [Planctomycetota bacterium]
MHLARRPLSTAALLLAILAGCGEEHHYAVDLQGNARRVDENGQPLPGQPEVMAKADAASSGPLQVVVQLDPSLGVDPSTFKCLFLWASNDPRGMPAVVDKVEHPQLPLSRTLAPGGAHGTTLSGNYQIFARLDADGDASVQMGDVEGLSSRPSAAGGPPVTVVLTRRVTTEDLAPAPQAPAAAAAPLAPFAGGGMADHAPSPEDLAGPRFKGRVELAPEFAALDGKYSLFIILRSATSGGMPLAPKKVERAQFPVAFDIGTEAVALDVDNKTELLSGELKVYARLSLSGNPIGQPGDIESEPVITRAGPDPIVLTLNKKKVP